MGPHEYQKWQRAWLTQHALLHHDRRRLRRMSDPAAKVAHAMLCHLLQRMPVPPLEVLPLLRTVSYYSAEVWMHPPTQRRYYLKRLHEFVKRLHHALDGDENTH